MAPLVGERMVKPYTGHEVQNVLDNLIHLSPPGRLLIDDVHHAIPIPQRVILPPLLGSEGDGLEEERDNGALIVQGRHERLLQRGID